MQSILQFLNFFRLEHAPRRKPLQDIKPFFFQPQRFARYWQSKTIGRVL